MMKQNQGSSNLEKKWKRLQQLQGNCQIETLQILKFSFLKAFTLGILLIFSILGAILLYNWKRLRVFVFYWNAEDLHNSSHVYIVDKEGRDDIQKIITLDNQKKQFNFKKLKYWIESTSDYEPVCFDRSSYPKSTILQIAKNGLSEIQVERKLQIYGLNEHTVDTPTYFEYMASVMFTPLYLLQYFVVLILSLQGLPLMGIILVLVSIITTSGNYIALYFSNKKVKEIAQKVHTVKVVRSGQFHEISSKQLVPGDIIAVQNAQMPCDAVLIQGEAYMNEHSLTGESVPVGKFSVSHLQSDQYPENSVLFEGTMNIQSGQNTRAMVIRTGFVTRKGRILRQILNRIPQQPDFFKKAVIFLIFSGILAIIFFFSTVTIKLNANIDRSLVWLSIVNFLLNAIPPAFPIYFTMAYSWSIYRLKQQNILTTMPQKTVESNRLKISCFDKTGTLTENNILLDRIFLYDKELKDSELVNKNNETYNLMTMLFGTCHTVRKYENEFLGDEVDLRMFEHSKFAKTRKSEKDVYEDLLKKLQYEVVKVHQFESKFQSMSVLVHDTKTSKFYCFSKGAPEKMMSVSINKIPNYEDFVAELALKGLRTIAFSFKEIPVSEVQLYRTCPRESFLENTTLIGLVTFENELKPDTPDTIKSLREAGINCKMITGDGIFIAVQTAIRAGIVNSSDKIMVIEGRKQDTSSKTRKIKSLILMKSENGYDKQDYELSYSEPQKIRNFVIAVDNDYLNSNPPYEIFLCANIFARIVPENKAKIINILKQNLIDSWENQALIDKIFKEGRGKISMAGDGANDLLAIKEADVGVGISNSDASYGAAFTVQELGQIIQVVKEGKCTTQNIIENLRYVLIVNFMNITTDILCSNEATFLSTLMALFLNFFMITTLPIISAYSKPDPQAKLSKFSARDNFMCLQNHLLTWGNVIILAVGLVGGYFCVTRDSGYIPNPKPEFILGVGYYPDCQLVTAMFLLMGVPLTTIAILVYKSHPWKNPIYRNIVLMIMLCLNLIIMAVFYVGNKVVAGLFGTVALPSALTILFLFLISFVSQASAFIYNFLVLKYLHPEYNGDESPTDQKVQITQTNIDLNFIPSTGN